MQKHFLYAVLVLIIWTLLPKQSQATHAAGGEISYEWVSDSTYRIYFKFYRDCSGAAAPGTSVLLCYSDTCNSVSGNVFLYKMTKLPDSSNNGSPVSNGCPGVGTRCTSTTSAVPSYQEWWYTNTVSLPGKCGLWKFSVNIGNRNPSGNLVNAGSRQLYAEAQLNNLVAQGNSSPYFSVKPVPSVCINKPYTYNNGGVDPNSDSLRFEMARPLHTTGNCPATTTIIPFETDSPAYNLTNNPIQTNGTFSIDSSNGQMTFTPSSLGSATMSIKINEYRNGVWIGSVIRDIQVQVINCNVPTPTVTTISNTIIGGTYVNGRVEACAGVGMTFCFDLKSSDTSALLIASDNHNAAAPNSTVNYTGQQSDSIRGCLSWTPGTLDTGLRVFTVTVKDSSCKSPGVIIGQTFVLPIYIWPITDIVKDTSICYGDSVQLTAVGGSSFTWSVISGGSPITTLSCTTCKQPYASPTTTTQYVVSNSSVQYCSKNKDTVSVGVADIRFDTLTATSNAPVCEYDSLKLYSTAVPTTGHSYYWTGPNGFSSNLQNPVISIPTSLDSGYYVLRSTRGGCFSNPDSISVEIKPAPDTPVATSNSPLCVGDTLKLFTPTASGATYTWAGPNSFADTAQNPVILNAGTIASGAYTIYTTAANGCSSLTDTANVSVYVIPSIDTAIATNPTTCSGNNGTIKLTGLSNSTTYTVNYKKNGVAQTPSAKTSNGSGEVTITNLTAGTYSEFTVAANGCESDTANMVVLLDPIAPVISVSSNTPVCQGDTILLTSSADSTGVTWSWTGPNGFSSSAQNPAKTNAVVADSGMYYLTASKNNCASDTDSVLVVVYPTPILPVANSNTPVCSGDSIVLSCSTISGADYYWSGPNSFTDTVQNPVVTSVQLIDSGDYLVYVKVNGCQSATDTTHVSVIETPSKPAANSNTPLCDGDTLLLTSSTVSGATYSWSGPSSFTSSAQNPVVTNVTPAMSGTYVLTVTQNGCGSEGDSTVVSIYAIPDTPTATNNTPICTDNTLMLFADTVSGATYSWIGPNSFTSSTQNPAISNADTSKNGIYTVIATVNGCASAPSSTTATISALPTPIISSSTVVNTTTCGGGDGKIILTGLDTSTVYIVNVKRDGVSLPPDTITTDGTGKITIDSLSAGSYTDMTVTSPIGCTSDALPTLVLSDPAAPNISIDTTVNTTTCLGSNGSITIKGLQNSATYTVNYNKNGVAQTPQMLNSTGDGKITISNLAAATYDSINVTIINCVSNYLGPIVINDPDAPVVSLNSNTPICNGDTLKLFGSADSTGVTWSWTGPNSFTSNNQNPVLNTTTLLDSGWYYLTAAKNNCTSSVDSVLAVIFPIPAQPTANGNTPVCSGSDLNLTTASVIGADYFWGGPNGFSSTGKSPTITRIDTNDAGKYYLRITVNGCSSPTDTLDVVVNSTPVVSSTSFAHPITCLGTEGSITLAGLLSNTIYSVDYKKNNVSQIPVSVTSDGSGNVVLTNLTAGTYSEVTVTINGCTSNASGSFVLADPIAPVINVNNNTPICQGDTLKLFGSADSSGVTWSWTGPNSFSSTDQNPVVASALPIMSGDYILTATKNNCTSEPDTTTATVTPTPTTPTAGSNSPVCSGNDLLITSDTISGATYSWSGPNGFNDTAQNPVRLSADTAMSGNYIVQVTVSNCISEPDTAIVVIHQTPSIASTSFTHPITCLGTEGTITLTGLLNNTAYDVSYKKNGTSQSSTAITSNGSGALTITSLTAGVYSEIKVALNNCPSDTTSSITLVDPNAPAVTASNNTPICQDGNVQFTATADSSGVTWSWIGPNSYTSAQQNPSINNALPIHSGVYTVTATLNNCTSVADTTTVLVKPTPVTPTAGSNSPICSGVTLFVTSNSISGATYSWSGPNGFSDTVQNPVRFSADTTMAGNYIVYVAVDNCISEPDTTTVVIHQTPSIAGTSYSHPTTCNGTDGSITLTGLINSGTYGVSYLKNGTPQIPLNLTANSSGEVVIPNLGAGTYNQIYVTLNACSSDTTLPITLSDPNAPVVTASNNTPICQDGNVQFTATADSSGVIWSWIGPNSYTSAQQNPSINNALPIHSGIYTVTATLNNCTSVADTTTVLVKPTPATPIANSNSPLCQGSLLQFTASTVANATYTWTGPNGFSDTSQNPSRNNADTNATGDYWVYVTVDGCVSEADTTSVVVHHVPSIASTTHVNPTTCNGTEGSITLKGLRNTETYGITYLKNGVPQIPLNIAANTTGDVIIPNLGAGTYSNIYVTLNGCSSDTTSSVTLVDPNAPVVTATNNTPICESDTIKLFAQADSAGVVWSWSGPNTYTSSQQNPVIANAVPAQSGVYTLTATLNNCTSVADTTTVLVKPTPATPVANSNSPICAGSSLFLTSSTISNADYSWSGPNSFTATVQNPIINNADTVASGNYIVYVTVNGCESERDTTSVVVHHIPSIASSSFTNPTTCLGTEGTITLTGLRNTETYTVNYMKNGVPQTSLNIAANISGDVVMTNLGAGTYSRISVLLNGCQSDTITSVVLTDPDAPVVTATNNTPICQTFNIILTGQADSTGVTWSWTGPNSFTSNQQVQILSNAVPAQSGSYILTATKNNCTSEPDTTIVLVKPTPVTPIAGSNTPVCSGNILLLMADTITNATYSWIGPNNFVSSQRNPSVNNVTTAATGTYQVIATVDGCVSAPTTTSVVVNKTPAITNSIAVNPTTCGGSDGSITLQGLDNGSLYTINYKKNGVAQTPLTLSANTSGEVVMSGLNAAIYSQIDATINGCPSDTLAPIVIENPAAPAVNATNNTPVCEDATAQLNGSSDSTGVVWNWTGPNSFTATSQNVMFNNAQPALTGNYVLTATKHNCTSEPDTTFVTVHPTPDTPYAINNGPLCTGNKLYLEALSIAGSTYSWAGPKGFTDTSRTPVLSNVDTSYSGKYIVIATVNGCVSEPDTTTVVVNPLPAPQIGGFTIGHPTTCGGSDGFITLGGLDINTTYTINYTKNGVAQTPIVKITNSTGSLTLSNLTQGNYDSMRVTSGNNGCSSNLLPLFELHDPNAPAVVLDTFYHVTTCGGTDGKIVFKGLVPGSTYSVAYVYGSNPQTVISKTGDANGKVVIDGLDNGIYHSISFTIYNCTTALSNVVKMLDPNAPEITAISNNPVCEGDSIVFTTTADSSNVTWSWGGPVGFTSTLQNPVIYGADTTDAGIYVVTATKNNCTSLQDTVLVNVVPKPLTPVVGSNSPICAGSTLTLTANSFVGAGYHWSGPNGFADTLQNPVINNADTSVTGVYFVYTTVQGCQSSTASISVQVNEIPTFDSVTYNHPTTCTGIEGGIQIHGLRNNETYIVNYKKNGTAQTAQFITTNNTGVLSLSNLSAGMYTQITVTRNSCVSDTTAPIVLHDPNAPVVTANNNTPICEGDTLKLFGQSDSTGVAWTWTGPNSYYSNTQNPVVNTAYPVQSGVYILTAVLNNCTSDPDSTTVLVKPNPTVPNAGNNSPLCNGDSLSLTATTVSGASYTWSGPNSFSDTNQNTSILNVTPSVSGWYYVFTTMNGCVSEKDSTQVNVYPIPSITGATYSNPTTCSGTQGSITLSGMTNGTSYVVNYKKNGVTQTPVNVVGNGSGTVTITGLGAGTYDEITVTIVSCVSNKVGPIVLSDPNAPTVTASNGTPICQGGTITLFGQSNMSGVTWSWTGPASFTSNLQNPTITNAVPAQSGNYYLIATRNNCTSAPDTTVVTVYPTPPTPTVNNNGPLCTGDSLILTASTIANAKYQWSGPNSFNDTNQNTGIGNVVPAISGSYNVTASINGCVSATGTTVVTVNTIPNAPTATAFWFYCQDDTATALTATGQNLLWYTVPTGGTGSVTPIVPPTTVAGVTDYYVSQTVNGCESPRTKITVTIHPTPALPVATPNIFTYCQNETATQLNAMGTNLMWYIQLIGGPSSSTAPTPATNTTGSFNWYVTQTNSFGCESEKTKVSVAVVPNSKATITASKDSICIYDSTVLNVSSNITGANYIWDYNGGNVLSGAGIGPYTVQWNSAGLKLVKLSVTNLNCVEGDSQYVMVYPQPTASFTTSANDICMGEEMTLAANNINGATYVWKLSNGITDSSTNNNYTVNWNSEGNKTITLKVVSAEGCASDIDSQTVSVHAQPIVSIDAINVGDICINDTIQIVATENADYTYLWTSANELLSNDAFNITARIAQPAFIYLDVKDAWSCTTKDSVFVTAEPCCKVYFPTSFTPNNDGKNDVFKGITAGHQSIIKFIVVNRWGITVFESNNSNKGWDGTLNGVPQDIGTYNYYIKYTCSDGSIQEHKGDVILIR